MINFYEYYNRNILDLYDIYNEGICKLYTGMDPKYNWTKMMYIIKTDLYSAYTYAISIKLKRWREVEKCIRTNVNVWEDYKWYFKVTE